jgi:hypothetical protein
MIQASYYQFVTGTEEMRQAAAHVQCEAGHILTKNNLFWPDSIKEISHCLPCLCYQRIRFSTRAKCAAMIGIRVLQIALHAINNFLGHLRATWIVKKYSL